MSLTLRTYTLPEASASDFTYTATSTRDPLRSPVLLSSFVRLGTDTVTTVVSTSGFVIRRMTDVLLSTSVDTDMVVVISVKPSKASWSGEPLRNA